MANKTTKKSKLEREYKRELSNLKRRIKTQEKKGYVIPSTVIPQKPKRVTQASINRLKNISAKTIKSKAIDYIPVKPALARFEEELSALPDVVDIRGMAVPVTSEHNMVHLAYYEAIGRVGRSGMAQFLIETESTWLYHFDLIRYNHSDFEMVVGSFIAIANILSHAMARDFTLPELNDLNALEEFFNGLE